MRSRCLRTSSKRDMNVDFVINSYGYISKEKLKAKKEINKYIDNKVRAIKLEIGDRFHIAEDDDLALFNAQTYLILKHYPDDYFNYEIIDFKGGPA